MARTLIKNIRLYGEATSDVLIEDGIIKEILPKIDAPAETIFEGKGLCALPGLVDMQVHFREPGQEEKETLKTGMAAAVRGGFTTVACMPNTNPTLDNADILKTLLKKIEDIGTCRVLPIPAMTKGIQGSEVCNYSEYKKLGILGVTDDGRGVQDDSVMDKVFSEAQKNNLVVFQHCEVESISHGAPIHLGEKSKQLGVEGQPGSAEAEMVRRDIELLEKNGGHYHVLHLSAADSLRHVQNAKNKHLKVTCEVTPHHLILADVDIPASNANFKMNPPLRSTEDREVLQKGLVDGSVDIITTDHAPHTQTEKSKNLNEAPFGIVGLETALPLIYTHFVATGKITMKRLVELMSTNSKELFKLSNGSLKVGDKADIVLVDLEKEKTVSAETFASKGRNTPFEGMKLKGWPVLTLFEGKPVYKDATYEI